MSYIADNIKFLRKQKKITQQQFADLMGVKRPVIGAYEEKRAEPKAELLYKMAQVFDITVDELVTERINEKWLIKKEKEKILEQDILNQKMRVLSITVDSDDKENIELVPIKASAGYLNGFSDPQFIAELPKFKLPMFNNGTFRAFELKGDSMLPLQPGTFIISEYVSDWNTIKPGETYVIISSNDGIVYKRIMNDPRKTKSLKLKSDNQTYETYTIPITEVLEIWKAKAYISTFFPEPINEPSIEKLTEMVQQLQKSVSGIKN